MYENICQRSLTTAEDFYQCVKDNTYNQSEIIIGTEKYDFRDNTLDNETKIEWTEILRAFDTGRCFTRRTLGKLDLNDVSLISFNSSVGYRVFLHDYDNFFVSLNPSGLPRIDIGIEQFLPKTAVQYIKAKRHVLMNRASSPCR